MLTTDVLHELSTAPAAEPVLSIYARTDPRDPANTGATPAWEIELRNGLRSVTERLEHSDDRDMRLAFRELRERVESELHGLSPDERARSVAWFVSREGVTSARFALQLPVREDVVVLDDKPFVSPLVDVADRGAPTGVVIVGREHVRLLCIEQGETTEPDDPVYEIELGDWRPFGGAGRALQYTSHQENYEARVEEQRDKLYSSAAAAVAHRLAELGWQRIALVTEGRIAPQFRAALPAPLADRIVVDVELNLDHEEAPAIAEALEPLIEQAWLDGAAALVARALDQAAAGGRATLGAQETLGALAEGRVSHLVLDPAHDFSAAAGMFPGSIGGPPQLLGERAVEAAIATGAQVTALSVQDSPGLLHAGGMVALLRY